MKTVLGIYSAPASHWVGDGFPVRTLFSYDRMGKQLSPFLLLDLAGPSEFSPADKPRGVGEHPHRGFETVTIVYSGEVDHRDSAGNGGIHRSRRRAVDDGRRRHHARGISFGGIYQARRQAADGAAVGQPAGEGQDDAAAVPDHRSVK